MKIKHIVLATAAVTALAASSSVFAIGASQGFYLAGQLGGSWNNVPTGTSSGFIPKVGTGTLKVTHNAFAWGVNGGYNYQIAQQFLIGGQIGVNGLGSNKETVTSGGSSGSGTVSFYTVNFLGTATYNIVDNFHVWAETGPSIAWSTASSGGVSNSESKVVWTLGAGVGYQWHKWDFFVRYDHFFGDSANNIDYKFPETNAVFGGVAYTF